MRKLSGLHLGHIRSQADLDTMRRHGIPRVANVTIFTAYRRTPRPPRRPAASIIAKTGKEAA